MLNLSSGIPQELIGSGIPRVRSSQASKGGEHPRVVLGQPNVFRLRLIDKIVRPHDPLLNLIGLDLFASNKS